MVRLGLEEGIAFAGQVSEAGHLSVVERPAADLLVRKRKLVQAPVSSSKDVSFTFSRDNGVLHQHMMDCYSEFSLNKSSCSCLYSTPLSFMASLVLAMTLSMYSLGCIEGRLAFLAPRSCCRFESMIRFGMEKSSDQDPAAEGAAAAEEEGALSDACVS